MTTLTTEDAQLIQGALDSLATALTEKDHRWTDGEREIYAQATRLLGVADAGE